MAGFVYVHRLAGDQHGRVRGAGKRQQRGCVRGREADAVHQQVGAVAQDRGQLAGVAAVGHGEPGPGSGQGRGQMGRVASGEINLPACVQQAMCGGPADSAGATQDECPRHSCERTGTSVGYPGGVTRRSICWWRPR